MMVKGQWPIPHGGSALTEIKRPHPLSQINLLIKYRLAEKMLLESLLFGLYTKQLHLPPCLSVKAPNQNQANLYNY